MLHDREHKDAAVGCAQGAAEHHGQRTRQRRADGAAGDDPQRVGGGVRDRALGDEAEAHDIVDDAVAALIGGPLFGEEGGGQRNDDGRDHAAHHDRGHDLVVAGGQRRRAEHIGGLVQRAAHVNAHQRRNDRAHQHAGGVAHRVQPGADGRVDDAHDRVGAAHDRADGQQAAQRVYQHRADAVEAGGQLLGEFFQQQHDVPGHKARQQRRQEAAGYTGGLAVQDACKVRAAHGQHTARKADGQARHIRNGHGHIGSQNRQHIVKRRAAHGLEEGRHRGVHAEVGRVDGIIVQQIRNGNHDAAAHHKGQHGGNTAHQMLVKALAERLFGRIVFLHRVVSLWMLSCVCCEHAPIISSPRGPNKTKFLCLLVKSIHVFVRR